MKRIIIFFGVLALLAVACGVQTKLPTEQMAELPTAEGTIIFVLAVPTPPALPVGTIANSVNLRACPGTYCDVLAVLHNGDEVYIVGLPTVDENMEIWQQVIAGGMTGYIDPKYLSAK